MIDHTTVIRTEKSIRVSDTRTGDMVELAVVVGLHGDSEVVVSVTTRGWSTCGQVTVSDFARSLFPLLMIGNPKDV